MHKLNIKDFLESGFDLKKHLAQHLKLNLEEIDQKISVGLESMSSLHPGSFKEDDEDDDYNRSTSSEDDDDDDDDDDSEYEETVSVLDMLTNNNNVEDDDENTNNIIQNNNIPCTFSLPGENWKFLRTLIVLTLPVCLISMFVLLYVWRLEYRWVF